MFIEPINNSQQAGWIEVVCGSMFSGKTEELIRRLKRAKIANMQVAIFKPSMDIRYHAGKIVSHDENTINATPLKDSKDILTHAEAFNVVGIDEAQFFDAEIVHVCESLANAGKRVIVAGLDMDYTGKPFGPMPALLSVANFVTKLHAVCIKCGESPVTPIGFHPIRIRWCWAKKTTMKRVAEIASTHNTITLEALNQFTALLKKEFLLETRQQHTLYGVMLYIASTVFVIYLTIDSPDADTWNSLFWITQLLFASMR